MGNLLVGRRLGDRSYGRAKLARGEGVEGAEADGEFGGGQAALAVEAAEKIVGGLFPFLGVAFHGARDQVAVGIASQVRPWHDVVQALHRWRGPAQTIEALAALARVDGLSQRLAVQKVRFLEIHRAQAPAPSSLVAARLSMRFSLTARISLGSRTSTTRLNLLSWTLRRAPCETRRRTSSRTGPVDSWILLPSPKIENRRRSFPCRRLCRMICEYSIWSMTDRRRRG